jgi:hypothetical protein
MNNSPAPESPPKLPSFAHAIAGWPLIMIFVGGALGGLCGGGAYGLSMALMKKRGVTAGTCLLSLLIGVAGVGLYFGAVVALTVAFPDLFGAKS